jgi:signal transduction histidine kinase
VNFPRKRQRITQTRWFNTLSNAWANIRINPLRQITVDPSVDPSVNPLIDPSVNSSVNPSAPQPVLDSENRDRPLSSAPLLLQLEWILLVFSAVAFTLTGLLAAFSELTIATLFTVIVLAFMRRWQPTRGTRRKVFYTALEFLVLLLPYLMDSRIRPLPPTALVIVIRGCQMFRLPGRIAIAGMTFILFILTIPTQMQVGMLSERLSNTLAIKGENLNVLDLTMRLNAILAFGLALTFILLLINALLEERQSRMKLAIAHDQLRQYALRIEDQSTLQERNRIAREIHDSLGHTLTAQSIQLDSALHLLNADVAQATTFLQTSKQLCTQALREVRQSVGTLRSDLLQGLSLEGAIATLLEDFRTTTNITVDCTINLSRPLTQEVTAAFYRITQEALTNITRHSQATMVTLQVFEQVFEQDQKLYLLIQDNGKGFDPSQNSTGFGLQSMRERAIALKGKFNLLSQPGAGCLITIQVPLSQVMRGVL